MESLLRDINSVNIALSFAVSAMDQWDDLTESVREMYLGDWQTDLDAYWYPLKNLAETQGVPPKEREAYDAMVARLRDVAGRAVTYGFEEVSI